MTTADTLPPTRNDRGTRPPIPPAYRSPTPAHLRDCVRRHGGTLPADVAQALLDAAAELEGSEEAFAELVDQKQALQRALAQPQSNLRAALTRHV